MAKISKRQQAIRQKFEKTKVYSLTEAIAILKECATRTIDSSHHVIYFATF